MRGSVWRGFCCWRRWRSMRSTRRSAADRFSEAPRSRSERRVFSAFYSSALLLFAFAIPFSACGLCLGAPVFARAERGDMGDVVAAVPGVEGERFIERHHAAL